MEEENIKMQNSTIESCFPSQLSYIASFILTTRLTTPESIWNYIKWVQKMYHVSLFCYNQRKRAKWENWVRISLAARWVVTTVSKPFRPCYFFHAHKGIIIYLSIFKSYIPRRASILYLFIYYVNSYLNLNVNHSFIAFCHCHRNRTAASPSSTATTNSFNGNIIIIII